MYISLDKNVIIGILIYSCHLDLFDLGMANVLSVQTAFLRHNTQHLFSHHELEFINVKPLSRVPWLDGKSGGKSKQSPPTTTIKMPLTSSCTSWAVQNPIACGRKTTDGLLFTTGSMLGSVVLVVCCKTASVFSFVFPRQSFYIW